MLIKSIFSAVSGGGCLWQHLMLSNFQKSGMEEGEQLCDLKNES